ncbi:hypothetical protein UB46_27420 [Burkholderiaceae bacterium 16]|nr:hypothetical protein UB46_27420 [Burkholderiaceae bacterium 16]
MLALVAANATHAEALPTQGASAAVAGPVPGTKMTDAYLQMAARNIYFWAWPMTNVYNRRLAFKDLPEPGLMGGTVPIAPSNRLSMLTDYIAPDERLVACPNQDVVYGFSVLALDQSPVVVQVPDFGKRFWVYQVVDLRTDSFAEFGKMYGTKPGFYLLVGPDWKGTVPKGITMVFRARSNTGVFNPRVFQDDAAADKQAVQASLAGVNLYPLAEYTGKMQVRDWAKLPKFPSQSTGDAETKWVVPEKFWDTLPLVLKDARPLPGEQARYAEALALAEAAAKDPRIKDVLIKASAQADSEIVDPLFQFRNYGLQLPDHWSTISNGAGFGTDYFNRTAAAKSNIFVNKQNETKYFYRDLDAAGGRLNGANKYTVTFAKGAEPPVKGFWSLTLYNQHHFFSENALKRYSIGTKNKNLKYNADGSLTLYVQADSPGADKQSNWLPAPKSEDFSLYVRAYWPEAAALNGKWTPPPAVKSN